MPQWSLELQAIGILRVRSLALDPFLQLMLLNMFYPIDFNNETSLVYPEIYMYFMGCQVYRTSYDSSEPCTFRKSSGAHAGTRWFGLRRCRVHTRQMHALIPVA